jgi:Flp pilus assembly secretin CpaC
MPLFPSSNDNSRAAASLLAGLTFCVAASLTAAPARADDLIVKFDQSQLLRLPRPAAEIIIGNPAIADVSIQTGNLLVVTGKSFGITNIIALDAERNVIQDQRILVRRDENKVVNVYRASERMSMNCAPQCNIQIVPGDDLMYFNRAKTASEQKIGFSEGAAGLATNTQQQGQ